MKDDQSESDSEQEAMDEDGEKQSKEVYLPTKPLEDGEELVCDQSAYVMLHQAQTGAPCLSFDVLKDSLGDNRESFPLTAYVVAGTQASQAHTNNVIVLRFSNLYKTNKEDDDDEESEEEEGKLPQIAGAFIKHEGCVNRIKNTIINNKVVVASWSELGRVNLWDISHQLEAVDNSNLLARYTKEKKSHSVKPLFTFAGHQKEGFALDWCPTMPGVLASGDCRRDIHIWKPSSEGWHVDQRPLVGHTESVEDLQWSPNERNVIASCSVDKSIRVWDTRAQPSKACMLIADNAHESDVNVISWNKNEPFIVSGGDDGFLHIWDLRRFHEKTPVATFKHHTAPVTSVEWHPKDSAIFASGGSDDQIALWDLSVEKDNVGSNDEVEGIPPQLLFIHQGQKNIKELHWHPQLTGVIISTAQSGFNIFRTISV